MIQRIQSLYLFIVTMLSVVGLCTSVGRFVNDGVLVAKLYNLCMTMQPSGERDFAPWALFVLLLMVAVVSLFAIFLFRRRMVQIRLVIFSGLLLVGYYVALACFAWYLSDAISGMEFHVSWTAALPAVSLILEYLAFRAIMRDEMIVRSLDRLR